MEIIKLGNLEQTLKSLVFCCTNCGCVFSADNTEYEYAGSHLNQPYYSHLCPTCGRKVYAED